MLPAGAPPFAPILPSSRTTTSRRVSGLHTWHYVDKTQGLVAHIVRHAPMASAARATAATQGGIRIVDCLPHLRQEIFIISRTFPVALVTARFLSFVIPFLFFFPSPALFVKGIVFLDRH